MSSWRGSSRILPAMPTSPGLPRADSSFPLASAFDTTADAQDGFVTKLSANGSTLLFSTFLGGSAGGCPSCLSDSIRGVALDPFGNVLVTGDTTADDFPVTAGALDTTRTAGSNDAFVSKISSTGSLVASTYLGGTGGEAGRAIASDPTGSVFVGGFTTGNFPTTPGAFRTTTPGGSVQLRRQTHSDAQRLVYSTYVRGDGTSTLTINAIAVDSTGAAIAAGQTDSPTLPTTTGAFDRTPHGNGDAFVLKLRPDGQGLAYGTYLGGACRDAVHALAVDDTGAAHAVGATCSLDFPTTAGA